MPPRDISMSDAEVEEFLSLRSHMVVGAIDADGWPVGSIAANVYPGTAPSRSTCPTGIRCSTRIDGDAWICCVDDDHATYYDIRGVIVHAAHR